MGWTDGQGRPEIVPGPWFGKHNARPRKTVKPNPEKNTATEAASQPNTSGPPGKARRRS